MNGQASLFEEPPVYAVPQSTVEFIAGFAARFAFGDRPTEAEKRAAARASVEIGLILASLKLQSVDR